MGQRFSSRWPTPGGCEGCTGSTRDGLSAGMPGTVLPPSDKESPCAPIPL